MQNNTNEILSNFRTADCEIFNKYFRTEDPWNNQDSAWAQLERFNDLEVVLFRKMVSEAINAEVIQYGEPQKSILLDSQTPTQALINREIDSGYWDYPETEIPANCEIQFMSYFDWDAISVRGNKFVRVKIASCPQNSSLSGKQALIDSLSASYCLRNTNQS